MTMSTTSTKYTKSTKSTRSTSSTSISFAAGAVLLISVITIAAVFGILLLQETPSPTSQGDPTPQYENIPLRSIFDDIYKYSRWQDKGDGSGEGSEPANTLCLRRILTELVQQEDVATFVDFPCGACKWTAVWLDELKRLGIRIRYFGFDLTDVSLERAQKNLGPLMSFHEIYLMQADLTHPSSVELVPRQIDLFMCRDTLQHLSYDMIFKALKNIFNMDARIILLGSYVHGTNRRIRNGDYFDINLAAQPFNMHPAIIYNEVAGHKYLFRYTPKVGAGTPDGKTVCFATRANPQS